MYSNIGPSILHRMESRFKNKIITKMTNVRTSVKKDKIRFSSEALIHTTPDRQVNGLTSQLPYFLSFPKQMLCH